MTVNREYVEGRAGTADKMPVLYPENIPGEPDTLRLTILRATEFRRGTMFRVEFREYPGRIVWAVKRGLLNIVNAHGDDETMWAGRVVVLEKVRRTNPRTGQAMDKYDFAPMPPVTTTTEGDPIRDDIAAARGAGHGRPRRILKRRPPQREA